MVLTPELSFTGFCQNNKLISWWLWLCYYEEEFVITWIFTFFAPSSTFATRAWRTLNLAAAAALRLRWQCRAGHLPRMENASVRGAYMVSGESFQMRLLVPVIKYKVLFTCELWLPFITMFCWIHHMTDTKGAQKTPQTYNRVCQVPPRMAKWTEKSLIIWHPQNRCGAEWTDIQNQWNILSMSLVWGLF